MENKRKDSEANNFQIWFSELTFWHYLGKCQSILLYLELLSSKESRKMEN